jgi:hypothetical protein
LESEDLQGLEDWIDEPTMGHEAVSIHGHLPLSDSSRLHSIGLGEGVEQCCLTQAL